MIQRIQTLWLLLAAIAGGLIFMFPIAEITNADGSFVFDYNDITSESGKVLTTAYAYLGILIISISINIGTIFLFKNRVLQMRLCVYNSLLVMALVGLSGYFAYAAIPNASVALGISAFIPFIMFILNMMARNGIKKDEALIRSVDRIR